jgi:hypothetical protein
MNLKSCFISTLLVVFVAINLLTSCTKSDSEDKTCWDCRITYSIGGPNRDSVICNDGVQPNFTPPNDANGNAGTANCTKR